MIMLRSIAWPWLTIMTRARLLSRLIHYPLPRPRRACSYPSLLSSSRSHSHHAVRGGGRLPPHLVSSEVRVRFSLKTFLLVCLLTCSHVSRGLMRLRRAGFPEDGGLVRVGVSPQSAFQSANSLQELLLLLSGRESRPTGPFLVL
jgi:hypothetical protein